MECPNCKRSMQIDGEPSTTYNSETFKRGRHKEYERTRFLCSKCDIWVAVEKPKVPEPAQI